MTEGNEAGDAAHMEQGAWSGDFSRRKTKEARVGGSGADGGLDLSGFFRGNEGGDEGEAKVERGSGSARGEQVAVADDTFVGEDRGQLGGHARVGGIAAAGEQAGVVEHGGGGADGGDQFAGGVVPGDEFADDGRGAEVLHAGATGQEEAVEGRRFGGQRGEGRVGVDGDTIASGNVDAPLQGGEGNGAAGTAEDVDRRDGFELFKTLWQDGEDRGHG